MTETTPLTYLFDPLCGWCYGASQALEVLIQSPDFAVDLGPTGLFSGEGAFAMNAAFAAHAWDADQRIAQLTGQPFSQNYRERVLGSRTARLDSGPASLALTAVHLTAPTREFEALKAIQSARYVEGRDNGDAAVIADILRQLSLRDALERFIAADEDLTVANRTRMEKAKSQMQHLGARGVPTVIIGQGANRRLVPSPLLYGDPQNLIAALRNA